MAVDVDVEAEAEADAMPKEDGVWRRGVGVAIGAGVDAEEVEVDE